jgi:hypothetical protein
MSGTLYTEASVEFAVDLEEEHIADALGYTPVNPADVLDRSEVEGIVEDSIASVEAMVSDEVTRQMATLEVDMKDLITFKLKELARNSLWSRLKRFLIRR